MLNFKNWDFKNPFNQIFQKRIPKIQIYYIYYLIVIKILPTFPSKVIFFIITNITLTWMYTKLKLFLKTSSFFFFFNFLNVCIKVHFSLLDFPSLNRI